VDATLKSLRFSQFFRVVCWTAFAVAALSLYRGGPALVQDVVRFALGTPHDRYAVSLKWNGAAATEAGRDWLAAADASLDTPVQVTLPQRRAVNLGEGPGSAHAFAVTLRRGQHYHLEAPAVEGHPGLFVDLFRREDATFEHVAFLPAQATHIDVDIRADGEYVVRVQAELDVEVQVAVSMRTEPTLQLPVERAGSRSIQSFFGDARDRGSRDHHGVDIFAPRGTPVLAASGGIVTSVGTNTLGGNVIWIARPGHREAHYYAHLDRQLVTVGTRVEKGDVIGLVGNTGNARATAPHLHFGIYAPGGPVDPLPYVSG
jgi:murein DD-endopeptidase MepM/ murein hydrolase activator NlpD